MYQCVHEGTQWRIHDFFSSREVFYKLDAGRDAAPALKKSLSGG